MPAGDASSETFYKLAAVIVGAGVVCAVLLSLRQARLQAANEFAEARLRVRMLNEQVSTVRAELANEITPDRIKSYAGELGVTTQNWLSPFDPLAVEAALLAADRAIGVQAGLLDVEPLDAEMPD